MLLSGWRLSAKLLLISCRVKNTRLSPIISSCGRVRKRNSVPRLLAGGSRQGDLRRLRRWWKSSVEILAWITGTIPVRPPSQQETILVLRPHTNHQRLADRTNIPLITPKQCHQLRTSRHHKAVPGRTTRGQPDSLVQRPTARASHSRMGRRRPWDKFRRVNREVQDRG